MLLSIFEELVEKHEIGRCAIEFSSVSVLVDVTYNIGIIDSLSSVLVMDPKMPFPDEKVHSWVHT
jgi:hypothetical protein